MLLPSTTQYREMELGDLFDLSAPQPHYQALIEEGGIVQPTENLLLCFNRPDTEFALRHHELFSSRVEMGLGNIRPMIPLNVDPPHHSKYRKLLDPLFAPKRMEAQEQDITRRVNDLIGAFIDRGECNFTEEFAEICWEYREPQAAFAPRRSGRRATGFSHPSKLMR